MQKCKRCSNAKNLRRKFSCFICLTVVSGWIAVSGGTSKERGLNSVQINFTTQVPIVYNQLVPIL